MIFHCYNEKCKKTFDTDKDDYSRVRQKGLSFTYCSVECLISDWK